MTMENFSKLPYDEEVDIFDRFFPDRWSFAFTLKDKLKYLEEAICTNKLLDQVCSVESMRSNVFLRRRDSSNTSEK